MKRLAFLLIAACWGGAVLSAEPVAPVRGDVVLSDRMSATFFQAKRDGTVVLFRDYPIYAVGLGFDSKTRHLVAALAESL